MFTPGIQQTVSIFSFVTIYLFFLFFSLLLLLLLRGFENGLFVTIYVFGYCFKTLAFIFFTFLFFKILFTSKKTDWQEYVEIFNIFFMANDIDNDKKEKKKCAFCVQMLGQRLTTLSKVCLFSPNFQRP